MKTCPTCGGRGDVLTPGWYGVQLFELGQWSDYLDYATLPEAIEKAQSLPQWRTRIQHRGRTVWRAPAHGEECESS